MYTICVSNLHRTTNEHQLKQLFSEFGEVKRVIVLKSMKPQFALVRMSHENEALAAVKATDGHTIQQQPLRVEAYFA